jgi:hypothetical protein
MGREGRAILEPGQPDPAHDPVAAGTAPDLVAARIEDIKGLAENQLIDRVFARHGVGVDVGDRNSAMHRPDCTEGIGTHNPLQRLLGQIGPGQGGAGIKAGSGCGQTWTRPIEPLSYRKKPKGPLTGGGLRS